METMAIVSTDRKERIVVALAGRPLDPTRLRASAAATTISEAREAAVAAGLRAIDGERALVRHRNRAALALIVDPLSVRRPGMFAAEWAERRLYEAYKAARYRRATHSHDDQIVISMRDTTASVSSETGRLNATTAGLPKAYARKAFSVATSFHGITAPRDWLRDVYLRGAALIDGRLVLELSAEADPGGAYAAAWVEQGRGTAIRLERGHVTLRGDRWVRRMQRRSA